MTTARVPWPRLGAGMVSIEQSARSCVERVRTGTGVAIAVLEAVLCVALADLPAQAQATRAIQCESPGGSTITGLIVDDSTGKPIPRSRVHLLFSTCSATADELGRFQFADVAAGRQRLHATHPGYRTLAPLDTVVAAGDILELVFRLRSGGPIEDCRVHAPCAELLRQSELESLDSEERFRLAAYATIIANTWNTVAGDVRWYACVEESSTAVLSELAERYGQVASLDQCHRVVADPEDRSPRLMHIDSGLPAYAMAIDRVRPLPGERRSASISYHVGPLWAAGWECVFEDASSGWQPRLCVLAWQS